MKLDFDICNGGRINGQNIIGIRYNGIDIFSLIGYYNAYTVEILPDGNKTVEFDPIYSTHYCKEKDLYYNMGDGSVFYEKITSYTYNEPGTYLIITVGELFSGSDLDSNYKVAAINGIRRDIKSLNSFCSNYSRLREFNPINVNTSNVTDMSFMFSNCELLTELDLSNLDTSNVTKMNRMFDLCSSLIELDISNFDTSSVTDISNMFNSCSSLTSLDLSNFVTGNVINMKQMFANCNSLEVLNLSNFDASSVTDASYMFYKCNNLHTLYLNNCSNETVNKIITSSGFPKNVGTIYCSRAAAEGLVAPTNWQFSYID